VAGKRPLGGAPAVVVPRSGEAKWLCSPAAEGAAGEDGKCEGVRDISPPWCDWSAEDSAKRGSDSCWLLPAEEAMLAAGSKPPPRCCSRESGRPAPGGRGAVVPLLPHKPEPGWVARDPAWPQPPLAAWAPPSRVLGRVVLPPRDSASSVAGSLGCTWMLSADVCGRPPAVAGEGCGEYRVPLIGLGPALLPHASRLPPPD
jgi:hypothetical protein